MVAEDKKEHLELIEKTIEFLEGQGYNNIKADIEGYETPKSFTLRSEGIQMTPDIVAENKGKVHYIEVGVKSLHPSLLKTKWKFLETISKIKNRGFRVVSHHGHYGFTDSMLSEINSDKTAVRI